MRKENNDRPGVSPPTPHAPLSTHSLPAVPIHFERLAVPVPPMLERVLIPGAGLEGLPRLVGIFCVPETKDVAWCDGARGMAGGWRGWNLWRSHRTVRRALLGCELGDTSTTVRDWLLLDRVAHRVYAGPADEVLAIARMQWCRSALGAPTGKHPCDAGDIAQMVGLAALRIRATCGTTPSAVMQEIVDADPVLAEMREWLDRRPEVNHADALMRMRNWRNQ